MSHACPYCNCELPARPILCHRCGQEVRLVLAQQLRIKRLHETVQKLKVQTPGDANEIPVRKPVKVNFLLATIVLYIFSICSTLLLLSVFSFHGGFHVYTLSLLVGVAVYSVVVLKWSKNISLWMPVLFVIAIPELILFCVRLLNFVSYADPGGHAAFYNSLTPSLTMEIAIDAFIMSTITQLLNNKVQKENIFSLKPIYVWMTQQTNVAQNVLNFISALIAVFAIISKFFNENV